MIDCQRALTDLFTSRRTFLSWLNFTVVLAGLSIGLLNFGDKVGKISAGMFTLVAMAVMLYALVTYHWRANAIRKRGAGPYDDRLGPTVLCLSLLGKFAPGKGGVHPDESPCSCRHRQLRITLCGCVKRERHLRRDDRSYAWHRSQHPLYSRIMLIDRSRYLYYYAAMVHNHTHVHWATF